MPAGEDQQGAGFEPAGAIHESATVIEGLDSDLGAADLPAGGAATPAGVASLDEFSRSLVELGLIDEAELGSFAADCTEGVPGLSRALVKAGKVTPYQAAAIYQKKSRGLLIGNYLIIEKLGQGGMGVVFKARHRRMKRVGALKILPPSFARDRDAVIRFRREAEAAGRLKHPNLVAAQDADEDRGVHFLVMDYVEGRDLDRIVRERGPAQVTQAIDWLIQAARGLEAAHAQGIVHRDIKPGNLMLDNAGTVRVLDLGLARVVDAANPFSKSTAGRLTQSGTYMGTVDYMAPEQAEDSHRVDHRADIYSLGCTLYFLLTGREPFAGETMLKRLIAHMERPAPSLRVARPDVPPALDAAYLKMMAKRPEDRPASTTEVIALFEASTTTADLNKGIEAAARRSKPELKVFDEQPLKRAGARKPKAEPSIFARPPEPAGLVVGDELRLEDLVLDVRPEAPPVRLPTAPGPAPARVQSKKRMAATRSGGRPRRSWLVFPALGAATAIAAVFVRYGPFSAPPSSRNATPDAAANVPDRDTNTTTTTIDSKTGQGSMTTLSSSAAPPAGDTVAATRPRGILARLDEPVSISFPYLTPLSVVLRQIKNVTSKGRNDPGIPVYVDPVGLKESGGSLTSTVFIDAKATPLKVVLKQILDQLHLAYGVKDDVLFVSSRTGVEREQNATTAVLAVDALPNTKQVLAELEEPISMAFPTETLLQDLLKYIHEATKIKMYLDPKGLEEAKKNTGSTFSIDLEGVPLRTTLRLLLKQLDLAYIVKNGFLLVTSPAQANREVEEGRRGGTRSNRN